MTLLLAISLVAGVKAGNASRYGFAGDAYDNVGTFACKRNLESRYGKRQWEKMRNHGVAHRTLPCGTNLGVCLARTGLCTSAYVVDRGPWGTLNPKGEWHQRTGRVPAGEHYRGELDLLPGTYSAIGLVGIEKVLYWSIAPNNSDALLSELSVPTEYPQLRMGDPGRTKPFPTLRLAGYLAVESFPPLRLAGSGRPTEAPPLRASGPAEPFPSRDTSLALNTTISR
jgi:hypothetical protein